MVFFVVPLLIADPAEKNNEKSIPHHLRGTSSPQCVGLPDSAVSLLRTRSFLLSYSWLYSAQLIVCPICQRGNVVCREAVHPGYAEFSWPKYLEKSVHVETCSVSPRKFTPTDVGVPEAINRFLGAAGSGHLESLFHTNYGTRHSSRHSSPSGLPPSRTMGTADMRREEFSDG